MERKPFHRTGKGKITKPQGKQVRYDYKQQKGKAQSHGHGKYHLPRFNGFALCFSRKACGKIQRTNTVNHCFQQNWKAA